MLHSLIIYLINFYYVEKALHLSEDTQKIKKMMLYSLILFVSVYLAIWIYDLKNYTAMSMNMLCSTLIYVVPSALNCLISFGTISIGFFI